MINSYGESNSGHILLEATQIEGKKQFLINISNALEINIPGIKHHLRINQKAKFIFEHLHNIVFRVKYVSEAKELECGVYLYLFEMV